MFVSSLYSLDSNIQQYTPPLACYAPILLSSRRINNNEAWSHGGSVHWWWWHTCVQISPEVALTVSAAHHVPAQETEPLQHSQPEN